MTYDYRKETPTWMIILLVLFGTFAIVPLINLIFIGGKNLDLGINSSLNLSELGQLGDFFGGHTAAFAGSLSLLVVLFFTFHQANQQRIFFFSQKADNLQTSSRQFFLEGINLITQWDIKSPGCDQCMRLLDYYGRLALLSDDRELLLLLNTVITSEIRGNLEGRNGSFKMRNYPYACEAIERIRPLREEDARYQKSLRDKT